MRNRAIDAIAMEKQVFTIEDARRTFGVKEASVKVILSRMEKSGWIERIERGNEGQIGHHRY
ncbi:MAG: type IV toxin-antitoxin system AbiEi family antitoxin domain-containing protein [Candidatus Thermoplasmatota archaeon]|jgi:predicted transcriptional regulator of viral defense system|nr:type IV toxin-antitoxin system AbiEi family antitoxin domain-containing protein [Candidatus Thermoplasmatota archaeon]